MDKSLLPNWRSFLAAIVLMAGLATAAKAQNLAGTQAWYVPANLVLDQHGRMFAQAQYPDFIFGRIDNSTGRYIWSIKFTDNSYFNISCSDHDRIYMLSANRLMAINADNGQIFWIYQHNADGYASLQCIPRSNEVFIVDGEQQQRITSIQKYSGQKQWEFQSDSYAFMINADWQNYYISTYKDGSSRLIALQQWNGQHYWTMDLPQGSYHSVDRQGRLYILNGKQIARVAPWSGGFQWIYQGSEEYTYLDFSSSSHLYARSIDKIARLDPDTGLAFWARIIPNAGEQRYTYAQILRSGDVLLRTSDREQNKSENILLDWETGQQRWKKVSDSSIGFITEDQDQNLYAVEGRRVIAYDRITGNSLWTYQHFGPVDESIFQIYGKNGQVYLTYGSHYSKYPPMGLVRLNSYNGQLVWNTFLNQTIGIIGSDNDRIYISTSQAAETLALFR